MFLLDTDTCVRILRGDPVAISNLRAHEREKIRISIPTVYELEVGLEKATVKIREKRQAVEMLLGLCAIAEFGEREAREAAKIRGELEKAGTPIGAIDYLIAGTARANKWTLVTGNLGEFSRVKGLKSRAWDR